MPARGLLGQDQEEVTRGRGHNSPGLPRENSRQARGMADKARFQKPSNRQHDPNRQGENSEQNIKLAIKKIRGELQLILISYIFYSFIYLNNQKREIIKYACI